MMHELGLSGQMFDSYSVWDHLAAAADIGYKFVEIRSTHINHATVKDEIKKVKSFLDEKVIRVSCLSCFVGNYGLLSDEECENAFGLFKKYVEIACLLDSKMIRMWPAWQESSTADQKVWDRTVLWMQKSCDYAAQFDKKLVMEMHHGTLCDTAESSLKLVGMINRNNVGLTLDPVNLYQVPTDYGADAIRLLGNYIFNVHIKDIIELKSGKNAYSFPYSYYAKHIGRFTPVIPPSLREERFFSHRRINQGGVDWMDVLGALEEIHYAGCITVESVSETNLDMPSGEDLAKACYEDIMCLQKNLKSGK